MTDPAPELRDVGPLLPQVASPLEGVAGDCVDSPASFRAHVEELVALLNSEEWLSEEKRRKLRARLGEIDARLFPERGGPG